MTKWKSVYKVGLEHRAAIVRDVLIDQDIEAIIISKKDSTHGFGFLEVQVPVDQVILAFKIIEEKIHFE